MDAWFKYYTTQDSRCIIRSHRLLVSRHCGTVSHCREKVRSEDGNDVSQSSNPIGQYLVHKHMQYKDGTRPVLD